MPAAQTCGAAREFAVEARCEVVGADEPEMPKSMLNVAFVADEILLFNANFFCCFFSPRMILSEATQRVVSRCEKGEEG